MTARRFLPAAIAVALCHTGEPFLRLDGGTLDTSTVRTMAGQPATLPCPGLGQTPFVVALVWLCDLCGVVGSGDAAPRPLLEFRDGRAESRAPERTGAGDRARLRLHDTTYGLVIRQTRADDTGTYYCLVNSRTQPKGAVRLEVKDTPSAPGRPLVLAFSSRTANISWTHPRRTNFSPVRHYLLHVRETERGPWDRSVRTARNETRCHVTELKPYTVYSFRVTAVNGVGAGQPSQASFPVQTLREAPSGQVTSLRANSRGATSVQLSWKPAAEESLHGEFLGYQLTYRSPVTGANRSLVITEQNVTTLVVTGLDPFTEYVFSLAIRNPRGLGPPARVTGHTRESVPGPPASLRYTEVGSSWVLLLWTPPLERNGQLLQYSVSISRSGAVPELRRRPAGEQGWVQYRADGLNPYTFYNIGVSTSTAAGSGPPRHVRVRTDTSAPGVPRILHVKCVKDGVTQVRWIGPPPDGGPDVSFYSIGYRNERDPKFRLTRTKAVLGEHTITMHNLDEGMTHFKVQAVRRSRYSRTTVYSGRFTDAWSALLPRPGSGCDQFRLIHPAPAASPLLVWCSTLAAALVLAALIGLILCRRRCRRHPAASGAAAVPSDAGDTEWRSATIAADTFADYVRDLQRGADAGFWKEMTAIDEAVDSSRTANGAAGHQAGVNGSRAPKPANGFANGNGVTSQASPVVLEGFNATYVLSGEDDSPQFWDLVRRHKVDTIVRFSNTKNEVPLFCRCWQRRRQQVVRHVQLDSIKPAVSVREFVLSTRTSTHASLLVVTRGADAAAALLVAADSLWRQLRSAGGVSPVPFLSHLRTTRPAWFSGVTDLKQLYSVLCELLRTADSTDATAV